MTDKKLQSSNLRLLNVHNTGEKLRKEYNGGILDLKRALARLRQEMKI